MESHTPSIQLCATIMFVASYVVEEELTIMSKSRRVSSRENEQDTASRAKKIRKIMLSFQSVSCNVLHSCTCTHCAVNNAHACNKTGSCKPGSIYEALILRACASWLHKNNMSLFALEFNPRKGSRDGKPWAEGGGGRWLEYHKCPPLSQ